MTQITRYTLGEDATTFYHRGINLGPGDVLVVDNDESTFTRTDEDGVVTAPYSISPELFGEVYQVVEAAGRTGHLRRLHANEQTRAQVKAELIVTGLNVNAFIKDALESAGIETVKALSELTETEVKERTTGLGEKRMEELKGALSALGLSLKVEAPSAPASSEPADPDPESQGGE